ncbi:nucleotide exchange factor GrpE [Siccirubricoccus sp. KC 17139]|uniref:Protein GrpE n=1 Tax=Siccirubricoccus soli TaxID=2899147 RepID=A0ABT1DDA5_9PROT|nr:nucleotide exchange factor GrpE [Siccirubricoccus soli]MCO6419916.1 nucleotide exchange factor GrpE [Siccirubricoccus soli]MCP2686051.1 nucleotide exchange factor GrpE [Siccirubricoccus soli]
MSDPAEKLPDPPATGVPETPAAEAGSATPEDRIAALEAELTQMRDRWLRSEAEMQNLRARTQREVQDARQYAIQKFAGDVVEAAQNLRRGLEALPPQQEGEPELLTKLREGFEGVERSFLGILERHGIARQEAQGQPFDPELHQAMAEQPAPEGVAPGTVIQAWTPAWTLNGRLLKPAMVVVAAGGTPKG